MSEPQHAYIATTSTSDEINEAGGLGEAGSNYTTLSYMYLNPSEAIRDCFNTLGKFYGEDTEIHLYEIDLSELDGVWPRVNSHQFNDSQLRWTASYLGSIPAPALHCVNSITKKNYEAFEAHNAKVALENGW